LVVVEEEWEKGLVIVAAKEKEGHVHILNLTRVFLDLP